MKAYKIKSLIYLCCFITAAIVYYHIEQEEKLQNSLLSSSTADLQVEDNSVKDGEELDSQENKQ